jgi:hypothetical protein
VDETEQNKDDIEHLEALEKHFEEKVKGYEVHLLSCLPNLSLIC